MSDPGLIWYAASVLPAILIYALGPRPWVLVLSALVPPVASGAVVVILRGDVALLWPCVAAVVVIGLFYVAAGALSAAIAHEFTGRAPTAFVGTGTPVWSAPREVLIATAIWAILGGLVMVLSIGVLDRLALDLG